MSTSKVEIGTDARCRQKEVHEKGHTLIFLARESELVGAIEICPTVRPEAGMLIDKLRRRGKQVLIISGDHEAPTRSLAQELGIDRYFSQVLPEEKSKIIRELSDAGRIVCFVGDGINDSIALQQADLSISMKGAASIATNVSQIVLMGESLDRILLLFDMADRFEHYMRVNRLTASIPGFIILGGTLLFGWGFATAVLVNQLANPIAIYSLLGPASDYHTEDVGRTDSSSTEIPTPPQLATGS